MIDLKDGLISQHWPNPDAVIKSYAYAVHKAVDRLIRTYMRRSIIYSGLDGVPESVLDLLAIELRTQYYDDTLPVETKRELVKGTLLWYTKAGTPKAVSELITAVFGEGHVEEWYEYGGEPYYFKILTNAVMTPDMVEIFTELIRKVKNARSHLEAIKIHREVDEPQYGGAVVFPVYHPAAIIDGYQVARSAELMQYAGAVASGNSKPPAIIDGYQESRSAEQIRYTGAVPQGNYRPTVITDGYREAGKTIQQALMTGASVMSVYKNTTEQEG
jgi:phage tail P2-like protein